jgi:hypothetical protein
VEIILKITTTGADGVVQMVECLSSKCKALSSNPLPPKKKLSVQAEDVAHLPSVHEPLGCACTRTQKKEKN